MTDKCSSAATIAPLLPCPFCGNKPAIEDRDLAGKAKTIFCAEHDCIGPSTTAASYDDAAMQWNRRAGAAQSAPEPGEILQILEDEVYCDKFDGSYDYGDAVPRILALFAARPPAAPVETATKSAPVGSAPHNNGERLPNGDVAAAGADTWCSADNDRPHEATQAQHIGRLEGEPAKFVRNGKLETCQCLECRDLPKPAAPDITYRLELLSRGDNLDLADIVCADAIAEIKRLRAVPQTSWQPIETAPKSSKDDYKARAFIAWCPDDTAPDGGDQRVVWWEPRMNKGAGLWWGDRDLEEHPTHWKPLGPSPLSRPQGNTP
jgi:hypothetical protein